MQLGEQLRASLENFLVSGTIEIREGGRPSNLRQTTFLGSAWLAGKAAAASVVGQLQSNPSRAFHRREVRRSSHARRRTIRPIQTCPHGNRVLAYSRSARQLARGGFCAQLRRILAERFPDETVEKLSTAADLEHSLSRIYVRGISRRGKCSVALLAVPESETPDAMESSLTFALLWLDHARQTAAGRNLTALRLMLPKGQAAVLAHRVAALHPRLELQIFEFDNSRETLVPVEPREANNVSTWLVPRREAQLLVDRASKALAPIRSLAPDAISIHPSPQYQEVLLRYLGVPFARWQEGRVFFGSDGVWEELDSRNESRLRQLMANFKNFRDSLALDTRHPLYRAQPERWMQVNILQDVSRTIRYSIPRTSTNRFSRRPPAATAFLICFASRARAA